MAILHDLPGIEVTVLVNGQPLNEYDDDEEYQPQPDDIGDHTRASCVSKYIESKTDQEFIIKVSVRSPYKMDCPTVAMVCFVDTNYASGFVMEASDYSTHNFEQFFKGHTSHDAAQKKATLQAFKFAKLDTSVEETRLATVMEDVGRVKGVGEITLRLYRTKSSKVPRKSNVAYNSTELKVHEKALKGQAVSHNISFGERKQTLFKSHSYTAKYLDGKDFPFAIFRFKYRSEAALKALLIIERTPEPEEQAAPAPDTSFLDALNPEQRRAAELYIKQLKEVNSPVKREHDGDVKDMARPEKKRKSAAKVEVDLTGDDE